MLPKTRQSAAPPPELAKQFVKTQSTTVAYRTPAPPFGSVPLNTQLEMTSVDHVFVLS